MSIELPEARILAAQMQETLPGKHIETYDTQDMERMLGLGVGKEHLFDFGGVVDRTIEAVTSRGNTIRVMLSGGFNIVHGPEYGGRIRLVGPGEKAPKHHLKLEFTDGSALSMRNTGMGVIYALADEHLQESYLYKRDYLGSMSPIDPVFTFEKFKIFVGEENRQLKPLLVGKEAFLTGISNATFQDVLFRAKVHPKTKANTLTETQLKGIYDGIHTVIGQRLKLGGKEKFTDLYGTPGQYVAVMGPNYKDRPCPDCGTMIQKLAHGGGHVYICPTCQVE
jgi:formamidopyrimidine-DNA glycosylase